MMESRGDEEAVAGGARADAPARMRPRGWSEHASSTIRRSESRVGRGRVGMRVMDG